MECHTIPPKNFNEDWLPVITTDHGPDPKKCSSHGGQADRERSSWIFTTAKKLNAAFQPPHTSLVDIMPTIVRFMDITPNESIAFEAGGYPFIGKLSFTNARFKQQDSILIVSWQPIDKSGTVSIWVSTTNYKNTGGKDCYQPISTVALNAGSATIKLPTSNTGFYKTVLQGLYNNANGWTGKVDIKTDIKVH